MPGSELTAASVMPLLRRAHAMVTGERACGRLHRAWELLQECDAAGRALGASAWTEPAIVELAAALETNPDDTAVVHHLAIARHARAWELELKGDPRAAGEWSLALAHWNALAQSGPFWAALKDKLRALDAEADAACIDLLRANLTEQLLDLHVDFVRQHTLAGAADRAGEHVALIRSAHLPRVVKLRMADKVFKAMTAGVADARAAQAHEAALAPVERFLVLFPRHLAGLRLAAEVAGGWGGTLSYRDQWAEICALSARVFTFAGTLAGHADFSSDPLARPALCDLAFEFGRHGFHHAQGRLAGDAVGEKERCAAKDALAFALPWARLHAGKGDGPGRSRLLPACLELHAEVLIGEAMDVYSDLSLPENIRLETTEALISMALAEFEETRSESTESNDASQPTLPHLRAWLEQVVRKRALLTG